MASQTPTNTIPPPPSPPPLKPTHRDLTTFQASIVALNYPASDTELNHLARHPRRFPAIIRAFYEEVEYQPDPFPPFYNMIEVFRRVKWKKDEHSISVVISCWNNCTRPHLHAMIKEHAMDVLLTCMTELAKSIEYNVAFMLLAYFVVGMKLQLSRTDPLWVLILNLKNGQPETTSYTWSRYIHQQWVNSGLPLPDTVAPQVNPDTGPRQPTDVNQPIIRSNPAQVPSEAKSALPLVRKRSAASKVEVKKKRKMLRPREEKAAAALYRDMATQTIPAP